MDRHESILIVEDSPTQSARLKHLLERQGYRLTAAKNGREALEFLGGTVPALVISDVLMPEMDGFELCHRIKHDERLRRIPVILLTSLNDPIDVIKGLECGADNFIFKGCEERYLLARISYILANRHLNEADAPSMGIEIVFSGRKFFITSDRLQILNLLLCTYEAAVHNNRELSRARDELRELNECLESKVRERTAALSSEVAERRRAEAEVRRLNSELEERVHERTAQLERVNHELEAFSYSVSHDLRSPLRHIAGFAELLKMRAEAKLDEKSMEFVSKIAQSAKDLGCLIDHLLDLAKLSRSELTETEVDLDALLTQSINPLRQETGGRKINWKPAPLGKVRADPVLMRQVFANLLSNAVKYTAPREPAEIEIGRRDEPGEMIIFVRDNGVGFDARYAAKLFGAFQRLHRADEFEGTGVGLANVRRIISRHGGRTWAESQIGQGATFYFSLPCSRRLESRRLTKSA